MLGRAPLSGQIPSVAWAISEIAHLKGPHLAYLNPLIGFGPEAGLALKRAWQAQPWVVLVVGWQAHWVIKGDQDEKRECRLTLRRSQIQSLLFALQDLIQFKSSARVLGILRL